jgi:hypothetical protein
MSVLDFVQQAKEFTLEERSEIVAAIQQQLFEQRNRNEIRRDENSILEIWSPDVDAASAKSILDRTKQRKPMHSRYEGCWRNK